MRVLVTGGCGFIGSHFIRYFLDAHPEASVVNLDNLTYAGDQRNLSDVAEDDRYSFIRGDICDASVVRLAMEGCSAVFHFAAESHVDRSLRSPLVFVRTNVEGTATVLEVARDLKIDRFLHMSTDEVYGWVEEPRKAVETDTMAPRSPYAASKAAAEFQCFAFHESYQVPIVVARASNVYGPNQFPEKLIPLFIANALTGKKVPVYGDGQQQRDWLYTGDLCEALDHVFNEGVTGNAYNVTAENIRPNIDVVRLMLDILEVSHDAIEYVSDRPGHDRRYAMDGRKLRALGWQPRHDFMPSFRETVQWYADNPEWWQGRILE